MSGEGALFDFIFEPPEAVDKMELRQGDLLQRTSRLAEALAQAHRYYAEAPDYTHFLVLTQSCDLVRRKGRAKSRYITLCAVRPLSLAVQRELEKHVEPMPGFPLPVGSLENSVLARQFLAKIGSLTSNLYSRIATPDLSERNERRAVESYKKAFFEELGLKHVAWLSAYQRKALEERVARRVGEGMDAITPAQAESLLTELPDEAVGLAERAAEVLIKRRLIADDDNSRRKATNLLLNDALFARLARRA